MQQLQQKGRKSGTAFNVSLQRINAPLSVLNSYVSCHSKKSIQLSTYLYLWLVGGVKDVAQHYSLLVCLGTATQNATPDAQCVHTGAFFLGSFVNLWLLGKLVQYYVKANSQKALSPGYLSRTLTCRDDLPSSHKVIRCSPRKGRANLQ